MFLYIRNVTIFPFNFYALISKLFSMLNYRYILFPNSAEQNQLASEDPGDLNIHGFGSACKYMLIQM